MDLSDLRSCCPIACRGKGTFWSTARRPLAPSAADQGGVACTRLDDPLRDLDAAAAEAESGREAGKAGSWDPQSLVFPFDFSRGLLRCRTRSALRLFGSTSVSPRTRSGAGNLGRCCAGRWWWLLNWSGQLRDFGRHLRFLLRQDTRSSNSLQQWA